MSRWRERSRPPVEGPADAGQARPCAANDNLRMLRPGKDPAAALLRVRFVLSFLRQENARRGMLLARPQWRRYFEECRALERRGGRRGRRIGRTYAIRRRTWLTPP